MPILPVSTPYNKLSLVAVNSVYQLLTAVHMRRTILCDGETDLLLTDTTPKLMDYLPRLKETGLFRRVISAKTKELSRKYAVGSMEEISEGYRSIPSIFRWVLSDELDDYGAIYFANFDTFMRMLACQYYDQPCAFVAYEDGFSSYVINYLREDRAPVNRHSEGRKIQDKVTGVLLYEPRLAMRGDALPNRALPKINRDDAALRELLNYFFDYRPPSERADFLFLEQSFRAEGLKNNDIELMRECRQTVGPGRFVVKPHPRNPENLPYQLGLTGKYTCDAPWELFLLNEDPAERTIITVCSNAALTGRLVFGMDMNTVMLYPLFQGKVLWQEDAVLKRYLRTFHRQFAGKNYYVPQTVYELRHILSYLGGRHEGHG